MSTKTLQYSVRRHVKGRHTLHTGRLLAESQEPYSLLLLSKAYFADIANVNQISTRHLTEIFFIGCSSYVDQLY